MTIDVSSLNYQKKTNTPITPFLPSMRTLCYT